MLRDAPGPDLFSGLLLENSTCTNDSSLIALNLVQEVATSSCSVETGYNFSETFPQCACSFAGCYSDYPFCVNGSGSLPTEDCIYGDQPASPSVLKEVCSDGFLSLFNSSTSCDSGLHNNFQVSNPCMLLLIHVYISAPSGLFQGFLGNIFRGSKPMFREIEGGRTCRLDLINTLLQLLLIS